MSPWLIYTGLTIAYIVILVLYFLRRSKTHEQELAKFLETAKDQLELHKKEVSDEAAIKITKALEVVKKVEAVAAQFEEQAQTEYNQIVEDAKTERRDILAQAKAEVADFYTQADAEIEQYKAERMREIERNLVKLVISITQKVVEIGLTPEQHEKIIMNALEEVKKSKSRL
jgi:flagellar biosynthesis/type III secretory pathway protein FliH